MEPRKVAQIIPSELCRSTFPCLHSVKIVFQDGTVETKTMDGNDIAQLYLNANIQVPAHFAMYISSPTFSASGLSKH